MAAGARYSSSVFAVAVGVGVVVASHTSGFARAGGAHQHSFPTFIVLCDGGLPFGCALFNKMPSFASFALVSLSCLWL